MTAAVDDLHSDRNIINTRFLHASAEEVFRAFSHAEHLARWWGPRGCRNNFHEFDFRAGGHWRFTMHNPDGTTLPTEIVFVSIERPRQIVMQHQSTPHFVAIATLDEINDGTRLTLRMHFDNAETCTQVRSDTADCNEQMLDRLVVELRNLDSLQV